MNLLQEFQKAIDIDYQHDLKEYNETMKIPLNERVSTGRAMSDLDLKFEFFTELPNRWCSRLPGNQQYIKSVSVSCKKENISKFKEGSSVILSNGTHKFEMDIIEDSVIAFKLSPNDFNVKHCYIDTHNYPKHNWEINTAYSSIGTKLLQATATLLAVNALTLNRVQNLVEGKTCNNYAGYPQQVAYLNPSQNQAFLKAVSCSDLCIIQGPPGTGKTQTIAYITQKLVTEGKKVFISAPTHLAINNCLKVVAYKIRDPQKVVKIGEKATNKEIQKNSFITKKTRLSKISDDQLDLSKNGIAIGATAYSLCYPASKRLEGWDFDVAIIDEASQLSIPLSLSIFSRVKKCIFVGDHKQLSPIIPKRSGNELFAESIFSRLARLYPSEINLLDTSYRLNEALINIPNKLFYNNQLHTSDTTHLDDQLYTGVYHSAILNSEPHTLVLHSVFDAQGRSPFEAQLVTEIILDLLQNNIDLLDIGILTPYRAQVREIRKQLQSRIPTGVTDLFERLFIDTVDSMQGQERDYIIYSMANSNPLESMRRLDFFYNPNRLNVAITRAKIKCIVIGNYKIFDFSEEKLKDHPEYQEVKEDLNTFDHYRQLAHKIEITDDDSQDDEW